jgi:hypothetical protein
MHQRFDKSKYGERLRCLPLLTTGCQHLRASEAFEYCFRIAPPKLTHQTCAQQVAG